MKRLLFTVILLVFGARICHAFDQVEDCSEIAQEVDLELDIESVEYGFLCDAVIEITLSITNNSWDGPSDSSACVLQLFHSGVLYDSLQLVIPPLHMGGTHKHVINWVNSFSLPFLELFLLVSNDSNKRNNKAFLRLEKPIVSGPFQEDFSDGAAFLRWQELGENLFHVREYEPDRFALTASGNEPFFCEELPTEFDSLFNQFYQFEIGKCLDLTGIFKPKVSIQFRMHRNEHLQLDSSELKNSVILKFEYTGQGDSFEYYVKGIDEGEWTVISFDLPNEFNGEIKFKALCLTGLNGHVSDQYDYDILEIDSINVSGITSVKRSEQEGITLFPNPVHNDLLINHGDNEIELLQLFSAEGVLLHSQDHYVLPVEVSAFPSGMYYMRYRLKGGGTHVLAFLKI